MKNSQSQNSCGFTTIPTATLNCIKQMLFSKQGIDLSNIINDIAVISENKDVIAINMALAYKGVKPELDTTVRYETGWMAFNEYKCVDMSLILNTVKCSRMHYCYNKDTDSFVADTDDVSFVTMSVEEWYSKSDDIEYAKTKSKR